MHFLINELSFIEQAENDHKADELMKNIFEIIEEISVLRNGDPIQTHSSFYSKKLSPSLTVKEWLSAQTQSQQTIAKILLRLLSKGPFIDLQDLLNNCQCHYQNQDVSSSSLAGAAKLQGILISLQNNPNFINENLEIEFQEGINPIENRIIKNLTKIKQARKICPRYKLHSKHDPLGSWKDATPMDLTDEEAQKVLNISVEDISNNSKKRYGFCKEKDQFYVFHSENTVDEQGYPTYHGFPISKNAVPNPIRNQIQGS